jgi:hypothetical protein
LFISVEDCTQFIEVSHTYNHIFHRYFQENFNPAGTTFFLVSAIKESFDPYSVPVEISPRIFLNINYELDQDKKKYQVIKVPQEKSCAFAWDYTNMHGIPPETCIHHIYTQENFRPV